MPGRCAAAARPTAAAPPGGRTEWLAGRLRTAIADGTLPVGSRRPASRVLAAELCASRGLVTEAYQRLAETGPTLGYAAGSAGGIEEGIATPATALRRVRDGLSETGPKVFPERRQPPGGSRVVRG
ncbi:GntR family transcriptional regulator [Streptomyces sp. NPDC093514]|uniref:GntR family transcriptional regulator n=1 Tax=Streptomyces sp. NPDC093514 TaxID=3366039 RepID=UPI0037FA1406